MKPHRPEGTRADGRRWKRLEPRRHGDTESQKKIARVTGAEKSGRMTASSVIVRTLDGQFASLLRLLALRVSVSPWFHRLASAFIGGFILLAGCRRGPVAPTLARVHGGYPMVVTDDAGRRV